jgi:5-methylthioadenosine/S-adenosylhomocysteine deaminase
MKQTLLKTGYIVTMNDADEVFDGGSVLVEDDKITAVGRVDPALVKPGAEIIELTGRYVLPGFVNTPVHTSQQISRGVGDDVDFICWLHERMWPFESNMTEEDSYISTLCAAAELIGPAFTSFAEPSGQLSPACAGRRRKVGLAQVAKYVMDCGEGCRRWQENPWSRSWSRGRDLEAFPNRRTAAFRSGSACAPF